MMKFAPGTPLTRPYRSQRSPMRCDLLNQVSKQSVEKMLHPTALLATGILIVVGLGVYQRLNIGTETDQKR